MKKRRIILVGGGGHCKSAIDVICAAEDFTIVGIVDTAENVGREISGFPIVGTDDDLDNLKKKADCFAVTVGQIKSPAARIKIYKKLAEIKADLPAIISPTAYVSPTAKIGAGTIIFHRVFVNSEAQIAENCIINSCALVEHENVIEAHCHISIAAVLGGNVTIKKGAFIGSNATVRQGVTVGEFAVVGAGSVVIRDVAPHTTVVGSPAAEVSKNG